MFFGRISLRIAISYAIAFTAGSVALFILNGYIFVSSLQKKDEDLLRGKVRDYAEIFSKEKISGLQKRVNDPQNLDGPRLIIRLQGIDGETLFLHLPPAVVHNNQNLAASEIERELKENQLHKNWFSIAGAEYGDDLEIVTETLPGGEVLQIGKDVEDRELFLENYSRSFFIGLIPIVALALLVGGLLSHRFLAPLRWLSETVKSIHSGQSSARVPVRNNRDELNVLGRLFNEMLDENAQLIDGIKSTIDNVAHDLRTPIMRMQSGIEEALLQSTSVEGYREALASCRENSEEMLKLLEAIMDISEAETGTLQLRSEPVLLSQIVERTVDLYNFVAETKQISIVVGEIEPLQVKGDRVRLLQAVSNLVDNAVKYSPEGSQITLSITSETHFAVIDVEDQGQGIATQELTKIWDRLYRGDQSRSTRGLGLGLSLVRAIVMAHHGTIEALPNQPKGMVFRLKLPLFSVA